MRGTLQVGGSVALAAVLALLGQAAPAAARPMLVISSNVNGAPGNGSSGGALAAALGVVVFDSDASNLSALTATASATEGTPGLTDVPSALVADANGATDVFLHEIVTGRNIRVSVPSVALAPVLGFEADGPSRNPDVSAGADLVVFESDATNLVPGDTNGATDVFVHDRLTGTTERVSVSSSHAQADGSSRRPSISHDARTVAFESDATNLDPTDANGQTDVYLHDLGTGQTVRVSRAIGGGDADGPSHAPSVSGGGLPSVAFHSEATNLIAGDTNGATDVFVHTFGAPATRRASISTAGLEGNGPSRAASITADGTMVAFESDATTLDPMDTNGVTDVFVRNLEAGTTERVTGSGGGPGALGTGAREADGPSFAASIEPGGRSVAFVSRATNLASETPEQNHVPNVYLADLTARSIELISSGIEQQPANAPSHAPAVAGDMVSFSSDATNLVHRDANGFRDVFATCAPETGSVSSRLHDAEPSAGPFEGHVHRASCALLAPLGL